MCLHASATLTMDYSAIGYSGDRAMADGVLWLLFYRVRVHYSGYMFLW